ncbi:hypothetical protein [Nocardia sp. NBC_00511]|uniref:hypothetical protein n=1 Tax=Nocardia sp. NBC_00511 TaxID=2903591 RepID=UPI0030E0246B
MTETVVLAGDLVAVCAGLAGLADRLAEARALPELGTLPELTALREVHALYEFGALTGVETLCGIHGLAVFDAVCELHVVVEGLLGLVDGGAREVGGLAGDGAGLGFGDSVLGERGLGGLVEVQVRGAGEGWLVQPDFDRHVCVHSHRAAWDRRRMALTLGADSGNKWGADCAIAGGNGARSCHRRHAAGTQPSHRKRAAHNRFRGCRRS